MRPEAEARGEARGEAKALARERALLERQVALRFGGDTAKRFGVLLAGVSDPERLAAAGEWLIECEDGASLLAANGRVESALTPRLSTRNVRQRH